MPQTLTLQLPDETLQRYQQSATAAHKRLEDFIVERLIEKTPLRNSLLPAKTETELKAMETLNDEALWAVARSRLAPKQQRLYNRLLTKNVQGNITEVEKAQLKTLGDEARLLTLKKAHVYQHTFEHGDTLMRMGLWWEEIEREQAEQK